MPSPFLNIGPPSALAFGLVLLSAMVTYAQTQSDIDKCSVVDDDSAQLQCYDSLAGANYTPAASLSNTGSSSASSSGPFGISMGLSMANVESLVGGTLQTVEGQPNLFATTTPPRAHPSFGTYAMEILPTAVADTYGEYEEVDLLLPGSIWDEPEDWMMGLRQNERIVQSVWNQENGEQCEAERTGLQRGVF